MTRVLTGLALVLALAAPAQAQATREEGGLVKGGISFLRVEGEMGTGFHVDFGKPMSSMNNGTIGFVVEFGFHNFGDFDTSFLEVGGGPRFMFTPEGASVQVFVQVPVGLFRVSNGGSANGFYFAPGGGVLFNLSDALKAFGQFDFVIGRIQGNTDNAIRFTFGIAANVGG